MNDNELHELKIIRCMLALIFLALCCIAGAIIGK